MWEWEEPDDKKGTSVGMCSMLSRSAWGGVGNKMVLTGR